MNRSILFAGAAVLALVGLLAIAVRTANGALLGPRAQAATPPGAVDPAGPVSSTALPRASSVVMAAAPAAPSRAEPSPRLPHQVMPTRTWSATVMTGAAPLGSAWAPAIVAPVPALVAPAPQPSAPLAAAPSTVGFGFAPAGSPAPDAPAEANLVATEAGAGPIEKRAAAVGPENEMATRAQRTTMAGGLGASPPEPPAAPGQPQKDPLAGWGPPPAPQVDPRRFTEAHWQGLEVVPKTPALAKALQLPPGVPGVVVDDVTLPADLQGFQAGDLVTHVGQLPTPDLTSFIRATEMLRDRSTAQLDLLRDKKPASALLTALVNRLGNANGETPSMIPPGARMPHEFRGPCTNCHRIGTTGTLAVDQGDMMTTAAPTIRVGDRRPHRDRGPCLACHTVTP